MRQMFLGKALRIVTLPALSACAGISVGAHKGPTYGGDLGPSPRMGTPTAVALSGARDPSTTKQVCRASGREPGWIAIDYIAGDGCVLLKGDGHPIALVTNYARLPRGTELEVCADERIPSGWTLDAWPEQDGRCPPDRATDTPRRTVKRIRRID